MPRLPAVALILVLLTACGDGESGSRSATVCAPPPPTVPAPTLPDGIPSPSVVTYTKVTQDSSVLTAEGFAPGSVDEVAAAYRSAFSARSLLTLGPTEQQAGGQASLSISGPSAEVSVTLSPTDCDRVGVLLELRPLTGP